MIKFLDLKKISEKYSFEINEAITRVANSGYYLQGSELEHFEKKYAEFIGSKYCIGVANGLDALRLILRAYIELGIMKEGDEIIVPANTYIASILSITENKLVPILVEPSIESFQIDDSKIEQAITPKTKGIMIVHLYGQCAYTKNIGKICDENDLILIEDNAQAHGCKYQDKLTGSIGNAAGHSFYPGKNLGAFGDAGAVTTDNYNLAEIIRTLSNYGSKTKYVFDYIGFNSRMDEIQAAVLSVKLKHLNEDIELRKIAAKYYLELINNPELRLPIVKDWSSNVFHIFPILSPRRDKLQEYLLNNKVQTLIHYPIPPHKQKCYSQFASLKLPITEKIHCEELSLPMSPVLQLTEIEEVANLLNNF